MAHEHPDPRLAADETDAVRERYARRIPQDPRYSLLNPAALLPAQERQRAIARLFARLGWQDLEQRHMLEVGCGAGGNLLELLRLGCAPERLQGVELLEARAAEARRVLPAALQVHCGDALALGERVAAGSQDVVYQATVFSSLLDDSFQAQLAQAMWRWVRPGGGVLWYDFTWDNPRNPDVRGVGVARLRQLFPEGRASVQRITLAPPLARALVRLHPGLYAVFNTLPWLRTHVLAWIEKRP
ncbi:class I SAM-dependent methyltransferase [Aquabacterium sp. A7-Y]|uniref:class I SAM-dependent methyltransferase n=1 Tax=Aquabacterium sp. A7-Y TaxID=1349605 RepID=UPI00223D6FD5|nr:class I SAM-dependent methyltransferase [Aquabacterium sp. A7-Y]MCW7541787.1 class I SAM-dependent methyltransferase [Aquabacterium sp. A7-Y]